MSYTWTTSGVGFLDPEEPGERHDLRCRVLTHTGPVLDPEEDCTCRTADGHTRQFNAGVDRLVNLFESYAPRSDDHADGAA